MNEKKYCKKVSFINEDFALQYIEKIKKTSKRTKTPKSAYLCKICFNWHLTSQESRDEKTYKEDLEKINNELLESIKKLNARFTERDNRVKNLEKKLATAYDKISDLTRSNDELRSKLKN